MASMISRSESGSSAADFVVAHGVLLDPAIRRSAQIRCSAGSEIERHDSIRRPIRIAVGVRVVHSRVALTRRWTGSSAPLRPAGRECHRLARDPPGSRRTSPSLSDAPG